MYTCIDNICFLCSLEARGQFTYWSKRTSAYESNSGLRIDYFVCSPDMVPASSSTSSSSAAATDARTLSALQSSSSSSSTDTGTLPNDNNKVLTEKIKPLVYDFYSLHDMELSTISDHCPIVLVVQIHS